MCMFESTGEIKFHTKMSLKIAQHKLTQSQPIRYLQHISIVIPSYTRYFSHRVALGTLSKVYFDFITRESQSHIRVVETRVYFFLLLGFFIWQRKIAIKVKRERRKKLNNFFLLFGEITCTRELSESESSIDDVCDEVS